MAVTGTWSLVYLGNFAEMDTDESDSTAETISILGTHGSAGSPLKDQVIDAGVEDASDTFDSDNSFGPGTITYDVGSGTVVGQIDHMARYDGTVYFTDASQVTTSQLFIFQTTNGDVFLSAYPSGPDLFSKAIESVQITGIALDGLTGMSISAFEANSFVCFAPGTRILTPNGPRSVESLREGDLVRTLDHGPQPLLWTGARTLRFPQAPDSQKPIEIKKGALGGGLPRRRLVVSPQHRIMLPEPDGAILFSRSHVLAPAQGLAPLPGVRRMTGCKSITYHALLFRRHEIILAEGQPVESLYPGPVALGMLSFRDRGRILARVPRLMADPEGGYGDPARPKLARRKVEALARHVAACV